MTLKPGIPKFSFLREQLDNAIPLPSWIELEEEEEVEYKYISYSLLVSSIQIILLWCPLPPQQLFRFAPLHLLFVILLVLRS